MNENKNVLTLTALPPLLSVLICSYLNSYARYGIITVGKEREKSLGLKKELYSYAAGGGDHFIIQDDTKNGNF